MQQSCPNCKTEIAEGKKFCPACGTKIEAPPPQPQAPLEFAPMPQQAPAPEFVPPPPFAPAQTAPAFEPVYAPPQVPQAPSTDKPPKGSPYAPIGLCGMLCWMALMCIPGLGWILAAIFSFAGKNQNRKTLARAMLVLILVGIGIAAALTIVYWGFISALIDLIKSNFAIKIGL